MEKYAALTVSFWKRQYYPHLLLVLVFVVVSGGFVSFRNLDGTQAAKVMEMYVSFAGIFLFTPLFMPEQDKEIWSLERSKQMPMWAVYLPRLLSALAAFSVVLFVFFVLLVQGGGSFEAVPLFRGAFCEILFLGSVGFFASAVTNNAVIGYMLAFVYYALSIGGKKLLGRLALFQMMQGEYGSWGYWLACGLLLFTAGCFLRERKIPHCGNRLLRF